MPFWVTALTITGWSAVAAWVNPAQFADSLEQFTWSHSIEFGYWKHPPLATWLMAIPIQLFGFSVYWTYALAAMCFIGTVFFTWRITLRLFGQQAGMFAALLIGLNIGFSWRAQLYNHNTVLLLFSAATVWATLLALDSENKRGWVLAGAFAGLAMLSKYQALIPLTGILIALYMGGRLRQASVKHGAMVALAVAFLVFLPHLIWLRTSNGSTIDNALYAAEGLGLLQRLFKLVGFWLIQIRFYVPVLIAVALLVLLGKTTEAANFTEDKPVHSTAHNRAWLYGLILWPAFFVSMAVLLGGVRLEAQWGLQTSQFLVVLIAWQLVKVFPRMAMMRAVWLVLLVQVVLAGFFAWSIFQPQQSIWHGMRSRNFPAVDVSKEITSKWHELTSCPLKYVVGPSFEATIVSAYSSSNPTILEDGDFKKSPWVSNEKLKAYGALYLADDETKLPSNLSSTGFMVVPARVNDLQPVKQLFWGIALPLSKCNLQH